MSETPKARRCLTHDGAVRRQPDVRSWRRPWQRVRRSLVGRAAPQRRGGECHECMVVRPRRLGPVHAARHDVCSGDLSAA